MCNRHAHAHVHVLRACLVAALLAGVDGGAPLDDLVRGASAGGARGDDGVFDLDGHVVRKRRVGVPGVRLAQRLGHPRGHGGLHISRCRVTAPRGMPDKVEVPLVPEVFSVDSIIWVDVATDAEGGKVELVHQRAVDRAVG